MSALPILPSDQFSAGVAARFADTDNQAQDWYEGFTHLAAQHQPPAGHPHYVPAEMAWYVLDKAYR